jgi:hypothetical protein
VSWFRQWAKSELCVQLVGIPCGQKKYTEVLEVGMTEDRPHQGLRYSSAPKLWDYKYVHQVREHRSIRYHASECDLLFTLIDTEAGRLQEFVHEIEVQTGGIRRDL